MPVTSVPFQYKDESGKEYEGVLCYDKSVTTKRPGVLVFHAFAGCTEFEAERAEELAKLGYVSLAADVYGKGVRGTTKEENFALMKPLVEGDRAELGRRILAARNALASVEGVDGGRIGAIGYCFGGRCALDAARRRVPGLKAAVSFHGTLGPIPGEPNTEIEARIQVHNGQADPHIPKDQILGLYDELNERKADWNYVEHGHALHAFTEPKASAFGIPGVGYQEKAARRSWKMTKDFLAEAFA